MNLLNLCHMQRANYGHMVLQFFDKGKLIYSGDYSEMPPDLMRFQVNPYEDQMEVENGTLYYYKNWMEGLRFGGTF